MQSRDDRSRCLRRQRPTRVFGVAGLARDWARFPPPWVPPPAVFGVVEEDASAVVPSAGSSHWVVGQSCTSVRHLNFYKIKIGSDPYEVLKAVDDKFEKQLTANGIIYTLHHGILPPAWGYAPRDEDSETVRHTAESIVSYRRSVPRLTAMIAAIRSRGRLERTGSFYDAFARTLSHVAVFFDLGGDLSLPAGLTVADRADGSDGLLGQLSVVAELLPADVNEFSPPDFGVSARDFNAFAGRLKTFLDGLSTVMSAAPFTTAYDDLYIPESEDEVDALRDVWSAVFPRPPHPTADLPVSMSATEHVADGVLMLVCVHAAAEDADTGEIRFADVFDSIETLYPGRVREFVADATGVDVNELGTGPLILNTPRDLGQSFAIDAQPLSLNDDVFQGLHDDMQRYEGEDDVVRQQRQVFCYFSTRRPDGKYHLSTSAFHPHALTPTRDAMKAFDTETMHDSALFQHFALTERGILANRFASAIISDSHRPRFASAHAVSDTPFAVFALNNAMRGTHGAPLPPDGADSFRRVMVRVRGYFAE